MAIVEYMSDITAAKKEIMLRELKLGHCIVQPSALPAYCTGESPHAGAHVMMTVSKLAAGG